MTIIKHEDIISVRDGELRLNEEVFFGMCKHKYDVIVVGGGPAGCGAAISAARDGADVLLIEQSACLGGMGVMGLVPAWTPYTDGEQMVYRSISEEVFSILRSEMSDVVAPDATDWVPIHAEKLKMIYDKLVTDSGARVLFNTFVADVTVQNGNIKSLTVANKDGLSTYTAKVYIDCTGDGDIAAWAGCSYTKGSDDDGAMQSCTLCFEVANVNMEAYRNTPHQHGDNPDSVIHDIVKSDKYPLITEAHMCLNPIGNGVIGFNAGHVYADNTCPEQVSEALILGRKMAVELHSALKELLPDIFGESHIVLTAPALGVRETRRIHGDYTLTFEDYVARRSFDDEIGRNCYFIDVHRSNDEKAKKTDATEAKRHHYGKGESHGIPYRCLIPKDTDNLLVAGRCISTDRPVQGSTRVMPTSLVTGEAAGLAASMAAKSTDGLVRNIDVNELRATLKKRGAYIL